MPRSLSKSKVEDFEPKRRNPLGLLDDSNLDEHLKSLRIGDKTTSLQLSENEFKIQPMDFLEGELLNKEQISNKLVPGEEYSMFNAGEGGGDRRSHPRLENIEKNNIINEEDIEVEVGDEVPGPEDEEEFIDIDGEVEEPSEEEEKEQDFEIDGKDETGRNVAFRAFERIEQAVVDSYNILSDEDDRSLFYDYLITNIKLYFDKFEDEILTALPEPTTPEYEQEKDSQLDSGEEDLGL